MDDMRNILVGDDFVAVREYETLSYWPDHWRLTPDASMTDAELENLLRLEGIKQAWG